MSLEEQDKAKAERLDTNSDGEVQEDNANGEPANGDTQDPQGNDNMVDATPPWEEQTQDEPGDGGESEGQEDPQNAVEETDEARDDRDGGENPGEAEDGGKEPGEAEDGGKEPGEAEDGGKEPGEAEDGGEEPDEAGETENRLPEGLKIVVQLGQGRATLGVWKPDADPHLETMGGRRWKTFWKPSPTRCSGAGELGGRPQASQVRQAQASPEEPAEQGKAQGRGRKRSRAGAGNPPARTPAGGTPDRDGPTVLTQVRKPAPPAGPWPGAGQLREGGPRCRTETDRNSDEE